MKLSEAKKSKRTLLIIDDEKDVVHSFRRVLADEDYDFLEARSGEEGVELFRKTRPEVVLMDVRMKEMGGLAAMREIHKIDSKALVIIMTAYSSTQTAIEAMKAGACDYITKPFDIGKMKQLIQDAMRSSESMKSVVSYQPLLSKEDHAQGIIGKSDVMQSVYKEIGRVAAKNIAVLLTGETGTGKELVARAIYHHSDRPDKRFLAINCGAIPELLLESELFGHERGTFTGAHARRIGKFEVCDGGTLFLDEIGELSMATQSKLLRVLQEKEIERLGGSTSIKVDVRVIAATNRNLRGMIRKKQFREDLFYRLNVVNIHMPTLRARKDDIALLVEYFLQRFKSEYGADVSLSRNAMELLESYDWPGNVRELENALKNSLVRVKGHVILPRDFRLGDAGESGGDEDRGDAEPALRQGSGTPSDDLDSLMLPVFDKIRRLRERGEKEDAFNLIEKHLVRDALIHVQGNQVKAARLLGITRSTLRKRMAKYGIQLRTNIEQRTGQGPEAPKPPIA